MEEELVKFGLNEREAKIYLALMKEKSSTASNLAKKTKINRTTTYLELENLIKKGLASYVIKDSKRYYQGVNPEKFLDILEEKKKQMERILPKIYSLNNPIEPFKVEIFEGKEGIKTFYNDIFKSCKEFYVLGATGKATEVLKYSYPHFVNKFLKAKIREKAIANFESKKIMEKHPKAVLEIKYLPKGKSSKISTVIYKNKVAIQSLQKDNIYVLVIKDKLLFQTYKNHFDLLWDLL